MNKIDWSVDLSKILCKSYKNVPSMWRTKRVELCALDQSCSSI